MNRGYSNRNSLLLGCCRYLHGILLSTIAQGANRFLINILFSQSINWEPEKLNQLQCYIRPHITGPKPAVVDLTSTNRTSAASPADRITAQATLAMERPLLWDRLRCPVNHLKLIIASRKASNLVGAPGKASPFLSDIHAVAMSPCNPSPASALRTSSST